MTPLTLCVLLWAQPNREAELIAYEDQVLELIGDYGGRVVQRARTDGGSVHDPVEVQILTFPSEEALDGLLNDDRRTALRDLRDRSVARTQLLRVQLV